MGQELRLQTSVSEAHTRETSRGRERGARPRPGESPAGEGTRAAAGPAPSPGAGDGSRSQSRVRGSLRAEGPRKGTRRVSLGSKEHIPATGQGGNLESRPPRSAVAPTKLGRRDARSVDPRVRAPPPAARHYLHEDPEEQGSDPDLDGQLTHGAAGAAPAREGCGWCSPRRPQLGRRRLARPGAAREARSRPRAGAGGGRRAPGGGGRRRGGLSPSLPSQAGGLGDAAPARRTLPAPRPRGGREAPRGLPAPERRLRALGPRRAPAAGEGKPGEAQPPRPQPLRAPPPPAPRQWAGPEQRARRVCACGRSASAGSASCARSLGSRCPAHARTWVCSTGRFGDSLGFQAARAPSVRAAKRSLPCVLPSLHRSNLKFFFFSRKFPLRPLAGSFCPQDVPARLQSPGTD